MRNARGWTMPEPEARQTLSLIGRKLSSSPIEVRHRDAQIRLRALIEDDLAGGGAETTGRLSRRTPTEHAA